eukprot:1562947-Amphidinium_carterae.1
MGHTLAKRDGDWQGPEAVDLLAQRQWHQVEHHRGSQPQDEEGVSKGCGKCSCGWEGAGTVAVRWWRSKRAITILASYLDHVARNLACLHLRPCHYRYCRYGDRVCL